MKPGEAVERLTKLKRELNAVVLAHNYQPPEVQDVADYVGDSLELSLRALESDARVAVFAGVDFMAEQAAVLNDRLTVLHPDPGAVCPMARAIDVEDVRRARRMYPGVPVVMYVNSPAPVKAEADYVVTSANALKLVEALEADTVIFGPDRHLAEYLAERSGKKVVPVPPDGHCPIHARFNPGEIRELIRVYGNAEFVAHLECPREVRALAKFVGSTSQMLKYVETSPSRVFIVGTEIGIIHRMRKSNPGKVFVPASSCAICYDMKKITLEKILRSIEERKYVISADKWVASRVKRAIENTFFLLGVEPPWRR